MAAFSKSKKAPQRHWRPDFREAEKLPDTKVIRTGFLLNFIAIAVALLVVSLYAVREYSLQVTMQSVKELERRVTESTPENRLILDANKRFRQSAELVEEAVAFDRQPVAFDTFIEEVSRSLPKGIQLTQIELRSSSDILGKGQIGPFQIALTGLVLEDAPATPAQMLSQLQTAIQTLPALEGKSIELETSRFGRNNQLGTFDFTLIVKIAVENPPSL